MLTFMLIIPCILVIAEGSTALIKKTEIESDNQKSNGCVLYQKTSKPILDPTDLYYFFKYPEHSQQ